MQVAEKHHSDRIHPTLRVWRAMRGPLLLLLIYIGFFWKLTLTRQYTWLESPDFANQVLPWYQFEAGEFHLGHFPLWDPYLWGGQPLLGQMQPGLSYPFNWILFALPLRHGWIRQVYLHWYFVLIHYMGGLFCYWLCRDLQRSILAATLAGCAFGLGGFVGTTDWPMMLNGAIWAPLVFLFFLRTLKGERPVANAALSGACLGMAFLSGHHQVPIFISLAMGGCWIYFLKQNLKRDQIQRAGLAVGAFSLFAASVSAFLMLPALEYGKLAIRWVGSANPVGWQDVVPYPVHAQFSLFPITVLGIAIPGIAINSVPYVGWVITVLAFIGVVTCWERQSVRILATVSLGGLLFSLGPFNVFHGVLYSVVPLVEKARSSSMASFIFHFGITALCAFGIDAWETDVFKQGRWPSRMIKLLLGAAIIIACVGLIVFIFQPAKVGEINPMMMGALIATLFAGSIYALRTDYLSNRSASVLALLLMLIELGIVTGAGYRHREQPEYLLKKMSENVDIFNFLNSRRDPVRVERDDQAIAYNFGDWFGVDEFGGYLASLTLNVDHIQSNYWGRMLFGTNYWIGKKPIRDKQIEVFSAANGLKIYSNPEAFPRVWSVHHAVSIAPGQLTGKLDAGASTLRQETFMTGEAPKLDVCPDTDQVTLETREANRVIIQADMGCKGMIIAAETYYPGWKATVDTRPEKIWEAYTALRGVVVGPGKHRIEMVYRPASVMIGGFLTVCGLVGALAIGLSTRKRPA